MSELKPCPFCGSKPKIFTLKRKGYVDIHYIECVNRKCNEPFSKAYDEEEVVKKWNTRHYPPEVQQAVERMKPKEPMYSYEGTGKCPVCRDLVNTTEDRNFCWNCGQALDWGEE